MAQAYNLQDDVKAAAKFVKTYSIDSTLGMIYPMYQAFDYFVRHDGKDHFKNPDSAFYIFQDLLMFVCYLDNTNDLASEGTAYAAFCSHVGYEPLSPDDQLALIRSLETDKVERLKASLNTMVNLRDAMTGDGEKIYHDFLIGLWCLILVDKDLNRKEYDFMCLFYNDHDVIPTWDDLQLE